jgi:hypothetical protein
VAQVTSGEKLMNHKEMGESGEAWGTASKEWHARPLTPSLETLELRESKRYIELVLRTWGRAVLDPYEWNDGSSVEDAISHCAA